ncbi:MAG: dihydroorotase [Ignavibacteriales bacterium CG_4_9_14_3_um_filter_34_10]|nr:MAG: dihydroorotase [Ignavibacteriales bacterium CG_4_9_14_3_um_filter_34_10]
MKILLKNLNLLNPEQKINHESDLLIEDGKIIELGSNITSIDSQTKTFDFTGMYCVPGLVDMHVHLREPGREDEETIETGSNAAAGGGFTEIACMPNTNPAIDSAEVVKLIKDKAKNHLVNVHPIGAVSVNRAGEGLSPIAELVDAGAVAFSDDGVAVKTSALLKSAMEYCLMFDKTIIDHCEEICFSDGAMNEGFISTLLGLPPLPSVSEDLIVARDILMAEYTGGKIHIAHISSKKSVELVRNAKGKGIKVTAEATPHHFTLTDDVLKNYDTNFKMSPPLRTEEDVQAIISGLKDGTIDCIASDHAPHSVEEKEMEFIYAPNGILGLETELALCLNELVSKNHLTLDDLVLKLSINPRKILNLPIPKFETNELANLTIFDPEKIWTVDVSKFKSKSKNSPFDKRLLKGASVAVINNSKMFFENKFTDI